ncbi:MAG TPA: PQQ-binding-like beta-propeller repeat protein [Vicinamibacterales bacterium]|nr:PQQ-binding-like beta-propeller repeat protein [Vicinamibacterales bacterium]
MPRARLVVMAAMVAVAPVLAQGQAPSNAWPQWGGPARDFHSTSTGLADAWPAAGPPVLWSRALGTGHSSIAVDEGRLFTMYRAGNGRAKIGPWKTEETVVALDAKTGETLWEHSYPARTGFEDFSFGPGPHATPLVVGDRVFTTGTNLQLFAFDKRTGRVLWSHDLVKEFKAPELLIRPVVKAGYGCSLIAFADTILCSAGGPGQSVMAFRQSDGAVVWKSGDFLTSGAAPILIQIGGRPQAVFLGGGSVVGLDPATGAILWSHPHDPGNDLNCTTPLFGPDNVLFMSSAYQAGSRAIQLTERGGSTDAAELWFTNRVRFMFLGAVRIGDFVYGTTGDFGPAFLTALDIKTGQSAWQVRGFARASLVHADGKVIVMNEDGDLALARLSPTGAEILSRAKLFDTVSWTAPALAGTTLYARDREKIVAVDVGVPGAKPAASSSSTAPAAVPLAAATPPPPGPLPRAELVTPLAGSWVLDASGSTVVDEVPFAGLAAKGAPTWLFITQALNGTLLFESAVNTSHARFYRPTRSTTTEVSGGVITMTSSWNGKALVARGAVRTTNGTTSDFTESIAREGDTLVIEITSGAQTSKLRYTKLTDVGPCTSWPTPCKKQG